MEIGNVGVHIYKLCDVFKDRNAVCTAESKVWTYGQMKARIEEISAKLLDEGVSSADRVAILSDPCFDQLCGLIAILRIGASYVALDQNLPILNIRKILKLANAKVVLTSAKFSDLIEFPNLCFDSLGFTASNFQPASCSDPNKEAYVLFTSGTTGAPKGVRMTHGALENLVTWQNSVTSGDIGGNTLQFASLGFDVSLQEILSTLSSGGTLFLINSKIKKDFFELVKVIVKFDVTRIFLPYVALQLFAEASISLKLVMPELKVIISSGEQLRLTSEIRKFLRDFAPNAILENQYGPSETHVVTYHTLGRFSENFPDIVPIGKAIDNCVVKLVGIEGSDLPDFCAGQIVVTGPMVFLGYLESGEKHERIELGSCKESLGARTYNTGDFGLRLADGSVCFLHRKDEQVKIDGFLVNLPEVELALRAVEDSIKDVAVIAALVNGYYRLIAFVVLDKAKQLNERELRTRLLKSSPHYQVPSQIIFVEFLPITSNGKRDVRELVNQYESKRNKAKQTLAIEDSNFLTSQILTKIFTEHTNVEIWEPDDDFFEKGGNSIGAMRAVWQIEEELGTKLSLEQFMLDPSISAVGKLVDSNGRAGSVSMKNIIPLQNFGTDVDLKPNKAPVFFVHPIGGHVVCYLKLARLLKVDTPLFGIKSIGINDGRAPLDSIHDMAVQYTSAIKKMFPYGPYNIIGWSFGGFISIEMARLFKPEEVENLIILDSIAKRESHFKQISDENLIEWLLMELLWQRNGTFELPKSFVKQGDRLTKKSAIKLLIEENILPLHNSESLFEQLIGVYSSNFHALTKYKHKILNRDITLFKCNHSLPDKLRYAHDRTGSMYEDEYNGWRDWVAGDLKLVRVDGNHLSMLEEPYLTGVADNINKILNRSGMI